METSNCGLLILNKPTGITSRQAVNPIARLAKPARVGHAGTLDPLATGVLVVGVGAATRWIGYIQRMPKRYIGTFLLGRQSPTEDTEGEVTELPDAPVPTREQIASVAERFIGRIDQRPPAFSAIKVAGRRAYELARRGQQPELAARPVEIHRIDIQSYQYPELVLDISCGSGTYVRSLGRDLAERLGTAAVMSGLVRTTIGNFRIEEAISLESLDRDNLLGDNWLGHLQPTLRAVECLPQVRLTADEVVRIRNGLTISGRGDGDCPNFRLSENGTVPLSVAATGSPVEFVAIDPSGQLVGILTVGAGGELRTLRNMPTV